VLVGAGRLHDEDVGAADRLLVAAVDLAVGKGLQRHLAEVHIELAGDLGGQLHRAAAAEDHHPLRVVMGDCA
jgi:Ser/Thr protein kinase RdoA (MazF antagonist)